MVLDLSFPDGHSVNSGIPSDTFINNPYKLHFPSVGTVARIIRQKGHGCLIFKKDLSRTNIHMPPSMVESCLFLERTHIHGHCGGVRPPVSSNSMSAHYGYYQILI